MSARRGAVCAAAAFSLALSGAAFAAEATANYDLDGDGGIETVAARGSGRKVEVTVTNASGRRLARTRVPSPASGVESLVLRAGELGSAGALLEIEVLGSGETCRSIWRLREAGLDRIPVRTGAADLPDCDAEGWSASWERPNDQAPSVYRRSRERDVSGQRHEEAQIFAFTGFALDRDPDRGSASINGIAIPRWPTGEMLPGDTLDLLREAFDYDPVRAAPRLFLDADRDAGVFRVRLRDPAGEVILPVRASSESQPGFLRLEASEGDASVVVSIAVRNGLPIEATLTGFSDRFDRFYVAVSRRQADRIVLYPDPNEDVAREILPGSWSGPSGNRIEIRSASGGPARVEMDGRAYRVSIQGAPKGTDVLLLPTGGSGQAWALDLRTFDGLARTPVQCASSEMAEPRCEAREPLSELYRRVGARMNRP